MEHGYIVVSERPPQQDCALAAGALADHQGARCGAMMLQGCGHGLQPWPQQFIRLVGGHRRPMPVQPARAQN